MLRWLLERLHKDEKGLTLIELLVVVAIIALLTTFAVPRLFDAINKSKNSVGKSDLQTVSSAVERWYFEKNSYRFPTVSGDPPVESAGTATIFMDKLKNEFVKNNTTFKNGFGRGYIYLTNAAGSYYLLLDPGNTPVGTAVTVTCGPTGSTWTPATAPAVGAAMVYQETTSAPSAAQLQAGCTISGTSVDTDYSSLTTN